MPKKLLSSKHLIAFASVLTIVIAWHLLQKQPAVAQNSSAGKQQAMPVAAETVKSKPTQIWNSYSARLEAVDYVEIRPEVSGKIEEVSFEDGQTVEAGTKLFLIDTRPYQAALNQAKAELAAARNQSSLTWKELKRAKELIKTNAISKRVVDERSTAHSVASSQMKAAQAKLDLAALNLEYAKVKAPISGRLSRAEIKKGNLVQAGPNAPILTTIISTNEIYADFEVDEQSYINFINDAKTSASKDKKIPVMLTIGENTEREGHIDSFDNRIDVTTGTIRARAIFDNADGALLPGMFATVKMGSPSKRNQITISEKAIGTDQDRKFVYVINDKNLTEYRQIKIGDSSKGMRVILSGLEEGEKVITKGIIRIRPGTLVAAKNTNDKQSSNSETE